MSWANEIEQVLSPRMAVSVILDRSGGRCSVSRGPAGACFRDSYRRVHAAHSAEQVCAECVAALALGMHDAGVAGDD